MSLVHLVVKARHGKNLHQSDVEAEPLSLGEPRGNLLMCQELSPGMEKGDLMVVQHGTR
jgi:hypothetical protein